MKITFNGSTNTNGVYVRNAKFKGSDGQIITVDRDTAEYTVDDDGTIQMTWDGCYILDGDNIDFLSIKDQLKGAAFMELEVRDDAPPGYTLSIREAEWEGKNRMNDAGIGTLLLSKEIQELLKGRMERATETGMHVVSVVYKGLITGDTDERTGYFDELVEAEIYADFLHQTYTEKYRTNHLVLIDGNIYKGLDRYGAIKPEKVG